MKTIVRVFVALLIFATYTLAGGILGAVVGFLGALLGQSLFGFGLLGTPFLFILLGLLVGGWFGLVHVLKYLGRNV